jgi:hypothetical protein
VRKSDGGTDNGIRMGSFGYRIEIVRKRIV